MHSELVLVVEDERDLATNLEYNLVKAGFATRIAGSGEAALAQAQRDPKPDLILLDLMLPDISGTQVCRELRARADTSAIPIIMVTAKGDEVDRIVGFELGAEDYVVKPFSVRELLLRVRAVLRRCQAPVPEVIDDGRPLVFGRLEVDPNAHRVVVDGQDVVLTALEFRLLTTLVERKGRVQTRGTLIQDVWHMVPDINSRTVDTHVRRLRQKLGAAGIYLETLRGVGYRWRSQPDEA